MDEIMLSCESVQLNTCFLVVYPMYRFIEDLLRDLTGGNSGQVPTLLPL